MKQLERIKNSKITLAALAVLGVFLLTNLGVWAYTDNRVYPGVAVNQVNLSGVAQDQVQQKLTEPVQAYSFALIVEDKPVETNLEQLGIAINVSETAHQAYQQGRQSFLPAVGLAVSVAKEPLVYEVSVDGEQFHDRLAEVAQEHAVPPRNAELVFTGGEVTVGPGEEGRGINRETALTKIRQAVARLETPVSLQTSAVSPDITEQDLHGHILQAANQKTGLDISLAAPSGRTFSPGPETILSWLAVRPAEDAGTPQLTVDENSVAEYVQGVATQINRQPQNTVVTRRNGEVVNVEEGRRGVQVRQEELVGRLSERVREEQGGRLEIPVRSLEPDTVYRDLPARGPQITYAYCIQFRGVSRSSYYSSFSSKAAAVLNAGQGWSLNGRIRFSEVVSACDFNLILASPAEVEALAPICDAQWSCRVGNQVAINVERWNNGTQAWTASLDSYRTMVINHEVGHWLGFGHASCPSSGAPAPVMQQQSISLQGCQPNPWPTEPERQSLVSRKGIN